MNRRAAAIVLLLSAGCGPPHIAPFVPRQRNYETGEYAVLQADAKPSQGSIYTEGMAGYLEDTRAVRVGDTVLVRIDEKANAQGDASTDLSRDSSRQLGVNSLLGLVPALQKAHPAINPANLVNLLSDSKFSGQGKTSRDGTLSGLIAVRVKRELPNEDLFVEGTKVVMINQEEYHLYVSGVIRPTDIDGDNSVPSSRLADAQVEFTGRGDLAAQVDRGWFAKLLDAINPF
ncbi:MAG TPA: flagellar basal body L-ring protein FlgH [Polyangiaceae bacterium]|nr:flagellar basal body L-ring protein FlgH [Polyangiaceae bacterium]